MKDKKALQILEKFKKARTQRQLKDDKWKELDLFDRGEQWEVSKLPSWLPKPVTNFIHLVKTTKQAALAIKNPTGKLRPVSPLDIQAVEELQKGYEYVWQKSNARKAVREAIGTSKLLGTGIVQIFWQEDTGVIGGTGHRYEGEIGVKEIDPSSFYPDPSATSLDECRFIHIVEKRPLEWLKSHPTFKSKLAGIKDVSQLVDNEIGEIYTRDTTAHKNDGQVAFHQHFEKYRNKEGMWAYKVTYVAEEKVLHVIDPLEPACYPFSILYDFPQRKDFWGKGTCELIIENQKIINKVESIIALLGTHLQNPQTIVARNAGIDPKEVAKYGSAPGKVWVSSITRPDQSMTWRQPPPIPQTLFQLAQQAAQNIRDVTGLTDAYLGQTVGSLQTSSGVQSLIERSSMRDNDQMIDVEFFIEDLSRKLIMFITSKMNETRMIRTNLEDSETVTEEDFQPFRGTDYADIEFDFFIDVSAKAPITRERMKEEANQLLTIQGQYGFMPSVITPQEYIKRTEMVDGDQIIERMNREEFENASQILEQVLAMVNEAYMNQLPPEEVAQMAQAMLHQKIAEKQQGIGNANTSQIQQQQQGTPVL